MGTQGSWIITPFRLVVIMFRKSLLPPTSRSQRFLTAERLVKICEHYQAPSDGNGVERET